MHVLVHIGAKSVLVSVGEGDQPVRWLANVGVARHDEQQGRSLGVPIGVKIDNGTMLNMQDSIAESGLTEVRASSHTAPPPPPSRPQPYLRGPRAQGQHVWVVLKGNVADGGELGSPRHSPPRIAAR